MAQQITEETIRYVASLAKLHLEPGEREAARADMQKMLDYMGRLNDLDTDDIEPMIHVLPLVNVFREDEVCGIDTHEGILENAPQAEDDQFVVPITIG